MEDYQQLELARLEALQVARWDKAIAGSEGVTTRSQRTMVLVKGTVPTPEGAVPS